MSNLITVKIPKITTLKEAQQLEYDLAVIAQSVNYVLDNLHCWSKDETLDRDALWINRARVQDAVRVLEDLKPLRKDLN